MSLEVLPPYKLMTFYATATVTAVREPGFLAGTLGLTTGQPQQAIETFLSIADRLQRRSPCHAGRGFWRADRDIGFDVPLDVLKGGDSVQCGTPEAAG
jgi:hypothetical protein